MEENFAKLLAQKRLTKPNFEMSILTYLFYAISTQ